MELATSDWMMAVARHPQFLKDYLEFEKLPTGAKSQRRLEQLCRKWKEDIIMVYFIRHDMDLNPKPVHEINDFWADALNSSVRPAVRVEHAYPPLTTMDTGDPGGKRLYLKVDVTKPLKKLKADFERWVRVVQQHLKIEKHRKKRYRPGVFSPWTVYDMKTRGRLTLTKIARALKDLPDIPYTDLSAKEYNQLRAYEKAAERAYQKACTMIDEVGKEAGCKPLFV